MNPIPDERLYEAAEGAAERFLSTLPPLEEAHTFSPEFEARMQPLLRKRSCGRFWRTLLIAAALIAALAVGATAGARGDCTAQIYWAQSENSIRYTIRVKPESISTLHPMSPANLPEGWRRMEVQESSKERRTLYVCGTDSFTLTQTISGWESSFLYGDYTAAEAAVGEQLGIWISSYDENHLLWTNGPNILQLTSTTLDADMLLYIAQNIDYD